MNVQYQIITTFLTQIIYTQHIHRITRKTTLRVHSFSSFVYKKTDHGPPLKYKDIKIISMDVLLFPINYDDHWSLFVVKDPAALKEVYESTKSRMTKTQSHPIFLFFDSAKTNKIHSFETIGITIITWLLWNLNDTNKMKVNTQRMRDMLTTYGYAPQGMY